MRTLTFSAALLVILSCRTNPVTGRSQFLLLDPDSEKAMGSQAYQEALAEAKVTHDPKYLEPVQRVAGRLAAVLESGQAGIDPPKFQWEFSVIDDPGVANAWCLPGGKIAVYTGIFPLCKDENGLAVVIGHEIMHAVFRHGNERVSQGVVAQLGVDLLSTVIGREDPNKKRLAQGLLGLGASVGVLLPYSRRSETESDEHGLFLAARAGYDPAAGAELWKRMQAKAGESPPEFLATHPNHGTRIENMQEWLPRAKELYAAAEKQPNHELPDPGQAELARARPAAARFAPEGARREQAEQTPVLAFKFRPDHDVFVDTIRVSGPGTDVSLRVRSGIPAGAERVLTIGRGRGAGAFQPGTYKVRLEGKVNGVPWDQTINYRVE